MRAGPHPAKRPKGEAPVARPSAGFSQRERGGSEGEGAVWGFPGGRGARCRSGCHPAATARLVGRAGVERVQMPPLSRRYWTSTGCKKDGAGGVLSVTIERGGKLVGEVPEAPTYLGEGLAREKVVITI